MPHPGPVKPPWQRRLRVGENKAPPGTISGENTGPGNKIWADLDLIEPIGLAHHAQLERGITGDG